MKNKYQIPLFRGGVALLILLSFLFCFSRKAHANDADLDAGPYGPEIKVGLKEYSRTYLKEHSFKISANKKINIKGCENEDDKNCGNEIIATVPANTDTKVKYDGDKYFRVYDSIPETKIYKQITFDSADGNNNNIIFDIHLRNYSYDHYRGKIRLRYSDDTKRIWAINILPLEQYVWGSGELAGTGDMNYNRTMTAAIRTYGYWKIKYSTMYTYLGFKVNATPGNQIYKGYEWEQDHPRIKQAAQYTEGRIVMYKGEIALTPYFSWSDGKTRRWEDGFNNVCRKITGKISKIKPWLSQKNDPYGNYNRFNNPDKSACTLRKEGNHMVGMTAHGALNLATNHGWGYGKILKYYYTGVSVYQAYE